MVYDYRRGLFTVNIQTHKCLLLPNQWFGQNTIVQEQLSQNILLLLLEPEKMSICHMIIELAQVTVSTVWSSVAIFFFSVTSNKSLSGQSKTLIRLRALWGADLCAPSFAANAKRPIFACCYFIISSNRWKKFMSYANRGDSAHCTQQKREHA